MSLSLTRGLLSHGSFKVNFDMVVLDGEVDIRSLARDSNSETIMGMESFKDFVGSVELAKDTRSS